MLANTTTPDGYTVDASGAWTENGTVKTKALEAVGTAKNERSIYGVWRKGTEARTPNDGSDYDYKHFRPLDSDGTHGNDWWYDCYSSRYKNGEEGRTAAMGWRWIDEDKEGNRDGILNLYYFDNYWMAAGRTVDGRQLNEDGAWVVDGVVQTISERRDVKSNTEWCGLTPGVYWDKDHSSRVEITEDKTVRYYDGSGALVMEGNVLEADVSERFEKMIIYDVEPTFDSVFNADPFENKNSRYLGISVDSGKDNSGRGYSSYGDISFVNSYIYGVFSRTGDSGRDRLFYYEG